MIQPPLIRASGPLQVALETTLLVHGVPRAEGLALAHELSQIVRAEGARPALIGVYRGRATIGLNDAELAELLAADAVPKANTANLGLLMHHGSHAATTVSATMELAACAGIRVFATGGLGGVHTGYGTRLDISADLAALARFPVAVVTSGVKSLLDVESTREAMETLGIPVVGFGTDIFPAFYHRASAASVDARFDDVGALAAFVAMELSRTGRGIVVANPIAAADEIAETDWQGWLAQARARAAPSAGREVTPAILSHLHALSGGRTLQANLALVRANARLAGQLATKLAGA